jgi:putative flavoprotein involved in K+ transport
MRVDRLSKRGDRLIVESGGQRLEAASVVVATGFYGTPSIPEFAAQLDPQIVQMHSSEYRNPSQLAPGAVLIVGAGNSGADIAMEVTQRHATWLSGRDKGQVPIRIESRLARLVIPVLWFLASHLLTVKTPIGRKVKPNVLAHGAPRVRVKTSDLDGAGVIRAAKTTGVRNGLPVLADGRALEVSTVIWATGFRHDYDWIDVPVFDGGGAPIHERGASSVPGLYFLGLDFLYSATSENVGGVRRDAKYIARQIGR